MERGELSVGDVNLAAFQLMELCKADLFPKLVFGVQSKFSDAEIEHVVNGAVEMFMARYGV